MRVHALVEDIEAARLAVDRGATVVQLRVKDVSTARLVDLGAPFCELGATFVVNDDVEAALALGADGVHLGRSDRGVEEALAAGLMLGLSAASAVEGAAAQGSGASYVGAGPVWTTPSKPDADAPVGIDGLRRICAAVSIPVIAIGGVDASNAADCIRAGAAGVALIRAASELDAVRAAVDEALRGG